MNSPEYRDPEVAPECVCQECGASGAALAPGRAHGAFACKECGYSTEQPANRHERRRSAALARRGP